MAEKGKISGCFKKSAPIVLQQCQNKVSFQRKSSGIVLKFHYSDIAGDPLQELVRPEPHSLGCSGCKVSGLQHSATIPSSAGRGCLLRLGKKSVADDSSRRYTKPHLISEEFLEPTSLLRISVVYMPVNFS